LLALLTLSTIPLSTCSESIKYGYMEGTYYLNITHVQALQTLRVSYNEVGYLLGGQQMAGVRGLVDADFSSGDLQINWSYDGDILRWKYDPPLEPGESITYIRRLTIETVSDDEGFRESPLMEVATDNASLVFVTRDVDIIDSSLPIEDETYRGNISREGNYLIYSSRYKLFDYSWHAIISNAGQGQADVRLNVSVPRDGGSQHVIHDSVGDVQVGSLGNRYAILEFDMPPGGNSELSMDFQLITETWEPGVITDTLLPARDLDRFLDQDARFWQLDDPLVSGFASSAALGRTGADLAWGLSEAVSEELNYVLVSRRRGALWAIENGMGSCMEYSDLFISSARYLGIPSLYVTGACGSGSMDDAGHAWAIARVPEHGWFGLDPTWASARKIDSGRFVLRYCDPEDVGIRLSHVGGDVSVDDWWEEWGFRELSGEEANQLMGVPEGKTPSLAAMVLFLVSIAKISSIRERVIAS